MSTVRFVLTKTRRFRVVVSWKHTYDQLWPAVYNTVPTRLRIKALIASSFFGLTPCLAIYQPHQRWTREC